MSECIFCRIVAGEIPADVVYETTNALVFRDLNPQAPIHLLAIPKKHITSINDLAQEDITIMGQLFEVAKEVAVSEGFAEPGYRVVMNCGEEGGQDVMHAHMHILAGRQMMWPPG